MNTIKEKMRYISNRIVVFGILTEVLFAIVLIYLIKEMMLGRIPVLPVIGIAVGICLLNVCFWETVTKPYHKWEKMVRRFLDGYQSFDEVKEQKTLLTPNSYEEMKKIEEILNSTQVKNLIMMRRTGRRFFIAEFQSLPYSQFWKTALSMEQSLR